jgi:hypothetical protein
MELPKPEKLAQLVSNVTDTMLGMRFVPTAPDQSASDELFWCNAILPIPGPEPLIMALSTNRTHCNSLASAMFACDESEIDDTMIEDAMSELANMCAGQLRGLLGLSQPLGLPRIQMNVNILGGTNFWRWFVLSSDKVKLLVSISDKHEIVEEFS